jgi:hypothetical protein
MKQKGEFTLEQYARELGVTRQRAAQLIAKGSPRIEEAARELRKTTKRA